MKVLICFFIGLLILISGNELELMININNVSLICNCVGVLLVGYSVKCHRDKEKRELLQRNGVIEEIRNVICKMPTNADSENIVEQLRNIGENQKIYEHTMLDFKCSVETLQQNVNTILDVIVASKKSIDEDIVKIINELNLQKETVVSLDKNIANGMEETVKAINELPKQIIDVNEELIEKINNYQSILITRIDYLAQDIEEQDKQRMSNFNKMIKEIREYNEENEEGISEKIETLSQQYLEFESFAKAIVQQMTQMAEQDFENMTRFLNE